MKNKTTMTCLTTITKENLVYGHYAKDRELLILCDDKVNNT